MILIEKTKIMGLEPTIRGMRNPMNSWGKSDSEWCRKAKKNARSVKLKTIALMDLSLVPTTSI